ncbi:hypothetical protein DFH27DRAFT_585422 [Peziza echinospora]|nr:hypothetical protein DFH27DRAFT_585422 [Peziza echinospora]
MGHFLFPSLLLSLSSPTIPNTPSSTSPSIFFDPSARTRRVLDTDGHGMMCGAATTRNATARVVEKREAVPRDRGCRPVGGIVWAIVVLQRCGDVVGRSEVCANSECRAQNPTLNPSTA